MDALYHPLLPTLCPPLHLRPLTSTPDQHMITTSDTCRMKKRQNRKKKNKCTQQTPQFCMEHICRIIYISKTAVWVCNIDLRRMHVINIGRWIKHAAGFWQADLKWRCYSNTKASVRLALNLPHTSSSHLDALTCTLHNAWAAWIYINPPHPDLDSSHTHIHARWCKNTLVSAQWQGLICIQIAMRAFMLVLSAHTHTRAVQLRSTQIRTRQKETIPWWQTDMLQKISWRKVRNAEVKRKKKRTFL